MVTDLFGSILEELGKELQITLSEDSNRSCLVELVNGQQVQLEIDHSGEFLMLGTDLGSVPSGSYRLEIFKAALKANGTPPPLHGIFAYSSKTEHLVLFDKLLLAGLTGEKVAGTLKAFGDKALMWKQALEHNEIPQADSGSSSSYGSGMFGLTR